MIFKVNIKLTLALLCGLIHLIPDTSFADYTSQDADTWIKSNPPPAGCKYEIEPVTGGFKIWKICGGAYSTTSLGSFGWEEVDGCYYYTTNTKSYYCVDGFPAPVDDYGSGHYDLMCGCNHYTPGDYGDTLCNGGTISTPCPSTTKELAASFICTTNIGRFGADAKILNPYSGVMNLTGEISGATYWKIDIQKVSGDMMGVVSSGWNTVPFYGYTWSGKDYNGNVMPDGQYAARITAKDNTGKCDATSEAPIYLKSSCDSIQSLTADKTTFNPNKENVNLTGEIKTSLTPYWRITIKKGSWTAEDTGWNSGAFSGYTWWGRDYYWNVVPEGVYTATLSAKTSDGKCITTKELSIRVNRSCNSIESFTADKTIFNPNTESVKLAGKINTAIANSWKIEIKKDGGLVTNTSWYTGSFDGYTWYGRDNIGKVLPDGNYTVVLTARTSDGKCLDIKENLVTVKALKSLKYISGDGQESDILASLDSPFVVQVVDRNNNPTNGNVTWQVTSTPQDAQGQTLSTPSGLNSTLTLGDRLGDYTITAICTDCTINKTVTFTAKASGPKLTLKLEREEVWPTIPATQKTPNGDNMTKVIAEVTSYNGEPLSGYAVEFKAEADETSGGHDSGHDEGRPAGSFSDNSVCYTDNGQCKIKYTASEFGGKEKITAKLQSLRLDQISSQSKDLTVKVPGLGPLGGADYSLKCELQDCSDYKHSSFYNTESWVRMLFSAVAASYVQKFPDASKLIVTDASLLWGGLYDYKNTWAPPHNTHRVGTDIDVRSKAIPDNNKKKFEEIACRNYGFPHLEFEGLSNEHYHIYFLPYNSTIKEYCDGGGAL